VSFFNLIPLKSAVCFIIRIINNKNNQLLLIHSVLPNISKAQYSKSVNEIMEGGGGGSTYG
jgi:hypothetical protein